MSSNDYDIYGDVIERCHLRQCAISNDKIILRSCYWTIMPKLYVFESNCQSYVPLKVNVKGYVSLKVKIGIMRHDKARVMFL